jgi:hypothetical protein
MRRWTLWAGASVVVLAGALLLLAFVIGDDNQFEFLEGRQPLKAREFQHVKRLNGQLVFYSFEADFPALRRRAARELKAKGYTDMMAADRLIRDTHMQFGKGDLSYFNSGKAPKTWPDAQVVTIQKDMKLETSQGANPIQPRQVPGWVTVSISRRRTRSIFDNFKEWLGL